MHHPGVVIAQISPAISMVKHLNYWHYNISTRYTDEWRHVVVSVKPIPDADNTVTVFVDGQVLLTDIIRQDVSSVDVKATQLCPLSTQSKKGSEDAAFEGIVSNFELFGGAGVLYQLPDEASCMLAIGDLKFGRNCLLCANGYYLEEGECKSACSADYLYYTETRSCFKCLLDDPLVAFHMLPLINTLFIGRIWCVRWYLYW